MGIMVQLVPSPRPCSLSLSSLTGRNFPDEPALVHHHRPESGKFPRRMGHACWGGFAGAGGLAPASRSLCQSSCSLTGPRLAALDAHTRLNPLHQFLAAPGTWFPAQLFLGSISSIPLWHPNVRSWSASSSAFIYLLPT